ncbi:formylglycine-generating enzyme [Plodia interpunctella]|uniref:formylglycine-generating enzyme n=1 Tax=Plodia interpunctella TaxID=58824 RepID=UPI0023679C32|nr:formylglycine-generating enzyme [Plodia interpunctella]
MMFLKYIIIILIFLRSLRNQETSCGCSGINRKEYVNNNIFSNFVTKDLSQFQCLIGQEDLDFHKDSTEEMILVPEAEYQVGTNEVIIQADKEGPQRMIKLRSFYLDKYEVSNRDFNRFVSLTNYKTEAELFGDSFVFTLFLNSTFKQQLHDFRVAQAPWWYKVEGANWRHPHGPDSDITGIYNHPVTHISWNDAVAYCKWRKARLPTEAEWEAACRGGHYNTNYPWGDNLYPDKKHMANIWQGTFPNHNSAKDGYVGTNPVDLFPQNVFGFYNMAGNVWEWTQDTWSKSQPQEKVKKGGSYLCHRSYCYRYRCSARSHNTADSSAGNLGFRCARSY